LRCILILQGTTTTKAMSQSDPDQTEHLSEQDKQALMDIDTWLEKLRRADRSFYNIMALEVWSIAKTMDGLIPGFWNRFMHNRQVALKEFMLKRRAAGKGQRAEGQGEEERGDGEVEKIGH
jgi:hypothetical protein